jgi:SAM-dependent methyltransferase
MPDPTSSSPLALNRRDDVSRVRDVLDRAGFEDRKVRERLGVGATADLSFGPLDRPRVLRRTGDGDALATLIRVFVAGVPVPLDAFRRAVNPMEPSAWAELGLVGLEGDSVQRSMALLPSGRFRIVQDAILPDGTIRRDHVMGVADSTRALSSMIGRPPARWALDLGTGCGYLALLAAAHSQHVLATDVNPRAVAMARFNAMLNRIGNVECAEGNLFEPAGDRRFDLIVSNPPFVVSPQDDLTYRDSGLQGDAFCERLFRAIPAHLTEGGFAQVMCNWARIAGQDWLERLSAWFEGAGCDVWIVHWASTEPGDYAGNWLNQSDWSSTPDRFAEGFERWMAYYEQQRIEAIDFGIITLRRRTVGRNWMRVDVDRDPDYCDGVGFLAGFAARDRMDQFGAGGALEEFAFACRPHVRVSQRLRPTESGWSVDGADCVLDTGLRFEGAFSPVVFHLLTLCRGSLPLSAVLPQVAARLGRNVEEIREECLEAARSLIFQGFLLPAEIPRGLAGNGPPEPPV